MDTRILLRLQERLKNLHVLILYNQSFKKKIIACTCNPRILLTKVMKLAQKKGRVSGQILCADLTSVSPVTHTTSARPGGCPSRRPMCQGSPSRIHREGLSSQKQAGACVSSQAAPPPPSPLRQSNRHKARTTVLVMTATHGFHVFWRLSGSKACGRMGRRLGMRPPSRRNRHAADAPIRSSVHSHTPPVKGTLQTRAV